MRIDGRIPLVRVDAVENARQHVATILQHAFQPATQGAALNLLRVARADRADRVGEHHARLQQVQIAVKLHLPPVEILPVESGQQHVPVPELALIRDVVNRQHAGDPLVARNAVVLDLQIGRRQARLPVVGVQHVDVQVQQPNGLQHGAAEKHEPLAVVDVVLAVDAVELLAVVILVLLDEIDRRLSVGHGAAEQMAGDRLAADRDDEIDSQRLDPLSAVSRLPVGGQNNRRLMPQSSQLDRQRPADVGQPAGLRKRNRFARSQQDVHGRFPCWDGGQSPFPRHYAVL